jgi:transcription-repair coupling factor (superfamily II helicase)
VPDNLLDNIFGPEFKQLITTAPDSHYTGLDNIHLEMVELAVAGIYCNQVPRRPLIWVVGINENLNEKAAKLRQWLQSLISDIPPIRYYTLPFEDPYINNDSDPRAIAYKIRLLSDIQAGTPIIVITTLPALSLKIEPKEEIPGFFQQIAVDGERDRDDLIEKLMLMGYRNRNIVEEQGDIAWRGSIVDVFPIDGQYPVRIEIEGDTVVSIRIFDSDTQKSIKQINATTFSISRYFLKYESFAAYFNQQPAEMHYLTELLNGYRMVVSDKKKIIDETGKLLHHFDTIHQMSILPEVNQLEKDDTDIGDNLETALLLADPHELFSFPFEHEKIISIDETWDDITSPIAWVKQQKSIIDFNLEDIRALKEKVDIGGYRLVVFSDKEDTSSLEEEFKPDVRIPNKIPCSFENPETRTIFLGDHHFQYIEKPRKAAAAKSDQLLNEISIDDLVVHQTHGIGRFTGFKKLTFEGHISEFLKIQYLNNEFLYVPVYELDVLSKYVSFEGQSAKVDKLGGNSWSLKKKRAQKSIIHFARDLLDLYAMRKAISGSAYPADFELESKLNEGFLYVETEDQKRAFKDVFADLEAEFPMDRLICGDVSFGKTEVAVRAAMRVVANGKQVAVLCPTTILAYQHFATFKNRFKDFPISIAMLSRMVTAKSKNKIKEGLDAGTIDIVIGTHSLISKHVMFKRLGLYIIDEEQRFGVFQKEKLKKDREDVDVLSMSATPIPRTLSLSLAGLQDISTIRTPPLGRMAVKNFVGHFSKEIVVSSILNELERDGQVFIVYNNIEKIYSFQEKLRHWLPDVSSVIIHAKMPSQEIETSLMDFIAKKYQVLLSTTIIENGIDIPDVNTLIILDADRFGLTQLYQLRGRIGRSHRQAYAYFLVKTMNISDKAKSRLEAIREFADLGSGYKLAEFDLKLRGAGSLLGNKQHGHIEALGFDYYHQLLVNTINQLKGDVQKLQEAKINIQFSYAIESGYIKSNTERIALYRRILEAEDFQHLEELREEMADRYGKPHPSVQKIFYAAAVRVLAKVYLFGEVDVYLDSVIIKFPDSAKVRAKLHINIPRLPDTLLMEANDIDPNTITFCFSDYNAFARDFIQFFDPEAAISLA